MREWLSRQAAVVACLVATLVATSAFGFFAELPVLRNAELLTLDIRFQVRGPLQPGPEVALVTVDEASIAELGRPPFSRAIFADAVSRATAAGARVIAFDLLFSEPQAPMPAELRGTLERASKALSGTDAAKLRAEIKDHLASAPDRALTDAIQAAGNVVVPYAFQFAAPDVDRPPNQLGNSAYRIVHLDASAAVPTLPTANHALLPIPEIADAAAALAAVNVIYDTDGSLRFEQAAFRYNGDYYPSLPIAVARLWYGLPPDGIALELGRGISLGDGLLPTDEAMRLLVNYRGPEGLFPRYSFADLVAGRIPAERLRNRIVLIGAAAIGFADTVVTPFSAALPRVERYAAILDMILRGDFLHRDTLTRSIDLVILLVVGLVVGLSASWMSSTASAGVALAALALVAVGAQFAFAAWGLWLHVIGPASMVGINFIAVTATRVAREERQRRNAERALRASEQRYALSARGANDGLWDWDLLTDRVYYSRRWRGMIGAGLDAGDDAPAVWFDRVHPDDLPAMRARLDAHLVGRRPRFRAEFRLRSAAGGTPAWMLARGLATRDETGRPIRIAGSFTDISDRKRSEDELRSVIIQAEAASRAKTEFLARMSHELRTPLNAIIGFSEVMLMGGIASNPARHEEYARYIHTSGAHLLALISDILDISRIEAGRLELDHRPLDLAAVLQECVDMVRPDAERTALRMEIQGLAGLPKIQADKLKMKQVFINLLSNAVKFSRPGGTVAVSADIDAKGRCWIAVRDRGIGIPAEDIDKVTRPFMRGTGSMTTQYGGTGLGLAIAKAIVELHDGQLMIDSELAVGTTVTVRLPRERLIRGAAD
jgi:PAS domain S-box-containing protein